MDDGPDTPMETDVSSTTQDVPVFESPERGIPMEVTVEIVDNPIEETLEKDQDQSIDSNTPETTSAASPPSSSPSTLPVKLKEMTPEKSLEPNLVSSPTKLPAITETVDEAPIPVSESINLPVTNTLTLTNDQVRTPQTINITQPPSDKSPIKVIIKKKPPIEPQTTSLTTNKENTKDCEPTTNIELPEKENSNDSQLESETSMSESSESRKNISRELKSLINSAKESKIINECNQLTSKTRKSRTNVDTPDSKKIEGRRTSDTSLKSNTSERSEKSLKRSMRSQNPEFVTKNKQFLSSVTAKLKDDAVSPSVPSDDDVEESKEKPEPIPVTPKAVVVKNKPIVIKTTNAKGVKSDPYCWRCHWPVEQAPTEKSAPVICSICPRAYHYKCLTGGERSKVSESNWECPECRNLLMIENRSPDKRIIPPTMIGDLLKYALERMMEVNGVEPFLSPVDRTAFPDYDNYVVHPMDLGLMKERLNNKIYECTEEFLSDVLWIQHNSIIFNTLQSKLTAVAKVLVRTCRSEIGEIEACSECYLAAHARKPTWFTDVCSTPHILLWAKLKGFPYWPAKGMSTNSAGLVDVRFFGAHDRAWVPPKDCYLYSEQDPNNFRTKRQDILDSMQEAEQHIRNLSRKFGKFVYPSYKVLLDVNKMTKQLKDMIPGYTPDTPDVPEKVTKTSKLRRKSTTAVEGIMTASKAGKLTQKRKSVGDIRKSVSRVQNADSQNNKRNAKTPTATEKTNEEKATPKNKENEQASQDQSRKRRRSPLEEAVITVIEPSEKKTRLANSQVGATDSPKTPKPAVEVKVSTPKANNTESPKLKITESPIIKNTESPKIKNTESPRIKIKPKGSSTPKIVIKQVTKNKPRSSPKPQEDKKKTTDKVEDSKTNKEKTKANKSLSAVTNGKSTKESRLSDPTPGAGKPKPTTDKSKTVVTKKITGYPTITNVRSLSQPDGKKKPDEPTKKPEESLVGKVGVRSFARMTSPCVKNEPIDEDAARQSEKIDHMQLFRLRPVNPTSLRDVRIQKPSTDVTQAPAKARKTFPQGNRPEQQDLTSKNSMVYIPIQATTGPQVRPIRPAVPSVSVAQPVLPVNQLPPPSSVLPVPTVGPIGSSVHTVPLITSVNGQWTFSLQPVMSVGGENPPTQLLTAPTINTSPINSSPTMNGIVERPMLTIQPNEETAAGNKTNEQLPRLVQKPANASNQETDTVVSDVPPPSSAGPITSKIWKNSTQLVNMFYKIIDETLERLDEPAAQVTALKARMEKMKWMHAQEIKEIKHNYDLSLGEMRTIFEKEKYKLTMEAKKICQQEFENTLKYTKSKQWCANCQQEAHFYCCWNTSYCNQSCQRAHWTASHSKTCTQQNHKDSISNETKNNQVEDRLQMPGVSNNAKTNNTSTSPKVVPPRLFNPHSAGNAPNIANRKLILSMSDEGTGDQSIKCIGSYKPGFVQNPVVLNNQIKLKPIEDASKKVPTSGGYLIVGATQNNIEPVVID